MMGFGLVGVVLLVGALVVFTRGGSGLQGLFGTRNNSPGVEENALEILNQRYARGELTRDQYQNIKKDLV
jgi:putative membrane protein